MGLSIRSRRLLSMLVAGRATVSADLLLREADVSRREVARARASLRKLKAPHGIVTAHGLGYRATPELLAWVAGRVAA
jgi:predicted DNA-binding transcriptional regulator YafY